jgi:hypothetical protein
LLLRRAQSAEALRFVAIHTEHHLNIVDEIVTAAAVRS